MRTYHVMKYIPHHYITEFDYYCVCTINPYTARASVYQAEANITYNTWEKFGVRKKSFTIFTCQIFHFVATYTWSSFANVLPSRWSRLVHSLTFVLSKIFPCRDSMEYGTIHAIYTMRCQESVSIIFEIHKKYLINR